MAAAQLGRSFPRPCVSGRVQPQRRPVSALLQPAVSPVAVGRCGRRCLVVSAAAAGLAHPGEEREDSSAFSPGSSSAFNAGSSSVPDAGKWLMKGGDMGSGSSMSATMERQPLRFVMPTPTVQGPKLDDGGSGGDIGKHNHNGGGGGDDGGDDDDFFSGDDDGEGGDGEGKKQDGFLRTLIPESYDKLSIAAVFAEWMRTVADLPLILRRAVEMGLFSSAQLVRFFSMDVRPSLTRSLTRSLPPSWARDFVGRLMADPAFAQKLVLESCFAGSASLYYEYRQRGDKFKQELDLAFINSIGMAAATAATVWLMAPTRSYGSVHKFPWQQMLDNLPNCVFDASGPLRQYSQQARIGSFFAKMAELSAVGAVTGGATSLACSAAVQLHKKADASYEPSTSVPSVGRSSGGLATFFATSANLRYQLIGGLDRYLFGHSSFLWTYLAATGIARVASQSFGEMSRPWWQGLPPPGQRKPAVRTRRVSKKVQRKVPRSSLSPAPAAAAAPVLAVEALTAEPAVASSSDVMAAYAPVTASNFEARSADVAAGPASADHAVSESAHGLGQEQYQVASSSAQQVGLGQQGHGSSLVRPLTQAA